MPIDPSIYGNLRAVAPIQTPSPLDLIGTVERVQGLREQTELRRLAGEKARQAAADDAAVRRALSASGGDPEVALTQLWQEAPGPAATLQKHLEETRKARMDAMKTGLENQQKQADLALQIARTVGSDGAGYGLARPAMVATSPVLDKILPPAAAPWDPDRWSQIMQAGVSGKDLLEHKQKVVDLFAQGKINEAVGTALSALNPADPTAGTQAAKYLDGAKALGAPEVILAPYRALLTPDGAWSPDAPARAAQLAISPKERETLAGQAAARAQTEAHQTTQEDLTRAGQAQTAASQAANLKVAQGHLAVAQAAEARQEKEKPGGVKLSPAQQEDISTMLTVQQLAQDATTLGTETKWEGVGPLEGRIGATMLGYGGAKGETLRNKIGNIQATIAKLRGGTSFTPNEQALLETYTPTITDTTQKIQSKLASLADFIAKKRTNTLRVAAGDYTLPPAVGAGAPTTPAKKVDPLGIR